MFVSISVVSYNRKKLTEYCINSIVKNTPTGLYELVVIDNFSSDGSVDMLRNMAKNGLMNKLGFSKVNSLGAAINKAWTLAEKKSDWLATFSNDHFVMKGWFENLSMVIEDKNPDYVFSLLRMATFHKKERKRTKHGGFYMEDVLPRIETDRRFEVGTGLAIKKELVEKHNIRFSPAIFTPKTKSPFSLMCADLIRLKLKKIELGKPCALEQDSEFNNPKYKDYYWKTFGQRAKLRTWERLKKMGYTKFPEEYYAGSGYLEAGT